MAKGNDEKKAGNKENNDGTVEVEIKKTGRSPDESDDQKDRQAGSKPKTKPEEKIPDKEKEAEKPEPDLDSVREEYEEELKNRDDRYLRLAAEFDNYKKRTARQFEEIRRGAKDELVSRVLEVVDNFERALEAANNSSDYDSLKKGMELIFQQLAAFLEREEVRPIPTVGEKFDPNLHEAIMQTESEEHPEGVITEELLKGYKTGSRVLRFARVAVSRGAPGGEDEEKPEAATDDEENDASE